MAPKAGLKTQAAPSALPVIEDEVHLPDGLVVPDPPFVCAVAHVMSHSFAVEGAVTEGAHLRTFDPLAPLLNQLKAEAAAAAGDQASLVQRSLVLIEREELESEGHLCAAFRKRVEAEAGARRRRKANAERKRAVSEHAAGQPFSTRAEDTAQPDLVLLLVGYPSTPEELKELKDDGCLQLPDSWVSFHLAGQTLELEEVQPSEDGQQLNPLRFRRVLGAPEVLHTFREQLLTAELGDPVSSCTVIELQDCHAWAADPHSAEEAPPASHPEEVEQVRSAILLNVSIASRQRQRFKEWSEALPKDRVVIPELQHPDSVPDTRLYELLLGSVEPSQQDVPLVLYCLCEQVAMSLKGDSRDLAAGAAVTAEAKRLAAAAGTKQLNVLEACFDASHEQLLLGDDAQLFKLKPKRRDLHADPPPLPEPGGASGEMVTSFLDKANCKHAGDLLPGGASAVSEVKQIISHLQSHGVSRHNFPSGPPVMDPAKRSAHRNRIYRFFPSHSVVLVERMLLIHEFESLLNRVQPERSWNLSDRIFHERIPSDLVSQTLLEALRRECFVDTAYLERQDALLVAMHHRALPGRVLWHSWNGDLLTLTSNDEETKLCPMANFNDWWKMGQAYGSNDTSLESECQLAPPRQPRKVLAADAREFGYCQTVEKVLVPSDGSVILRTGLHRGVLDSIAPLSEDGQRTAIPEPVKTDDSTLQADADDVEEETADKNKQEVKSKVFVPAPRHEMQSLRIVKDGLTFGMVTDAAWQSTTAIMRKRLFEKLGTDGAVEIETKQKVDDEDSGDEEAKMAQQERRLVEQRFGRLWAAFQDGARCTIQMHHERPWFGESDEFYDVTIARPGVQVNYTSVSGLLVQVYSDGRIRQVFPAQRLFSSPVSSSGSDPSANPRAIPGDLEDVQLARSVNPFGILVLEMLSGRKEVYHPDGTRAIRNPTSEEIAARLQKMRVSRKVRRCDAISSSLLRRLEQIAASWEAFQATGYGSGAPLPHLKSAGIPGHWVITTTDGRRFGRYAAPVPPAPVAEDLKTMPARQGSVTGSGHGSQVGSVQPGSQQPTPRKEGSVEEDEVEEESEEDEPQKTLELIDILEGWVVDDSENIQYEVYPSATTFLRDAHTGQQTISSEEGFLMMSDPDGLSWTLVLADGTRVIKSKKMDGHQVIVEKERSARVICHVNDKAYNPGSLMQVECDDGTLLEVTPRRLNDKAELVPADPFVFLANLRGENLDDFTAADAEGSLDRAQARVDMVTGNPDPRFYDFCTNTSVLLRRVEGTLLHSKGAGEVEIISNYDVAAMGEEKALKTAQDRGGVYLANIEADKICMRDNDGNSFEVRGDQTVDFTLAVSMGDDFMSPRCILPKQPYKHPDASFLPLPEDAPAPRLFVVYGDGEAEELHVPRDVAEALRLARKDPNAFVEQEKLKWPMEGCSCHSIHRTASLDPVDLPMRMLSMPPSIAGPAGTSRVSRTFTEFRQFIEYPSITVEERKAFHTALEQYTIEEERQKTRHLSYSQGSERTKSYDRAAAYPVQITPVPEQAERGGA